MGGAAILILSFVATTTAVTLMKGTLAPRLRLGARVVLALAAAVVAFAAPAIVGWFTPTTSTVLAGLTSSLMQICHLVGVGGGLLMATKLDKR